MLRMGIFFGNVQNPTMDALVGFSAWFMRLAGYTGKPANLMPWPWAERFLSRAGLAGFFLLACLPPLAWDHTAPLSSWQGEFFAALSGLLACTPLFRSAAWRELRLSSIFVVPSLLAITAGAQLLTHHAALRSGALLTILEMAWATLLMLSAQALIQQGKAELFAKALACGLLVAGMIGGVIGWIQVQEYAAFRHIPALYSPSGVAVGLLAQRNLFADVQTLALFSAPFLFAPLSSRSRGFARALALLLVCALLLVSIADSTSYAAIGYLAFGVIYFRMSLRTRHGAGLVHDFNYSIERVGTVVAGGIACVFLAFSLHEKAISASGHSFAGPVLRTLWMEALRLMAHRPLSGIGIGGTALAFFHFAGRLPDTPAFAAFHNQGWNNVHNLVLQLGLEFGAAGFIAALMLAAWGLVTAWRILQYGEAWQIWAIVCLGVLGMHSMVEYPLWTLPFLGLLASLLGALSTHTETQRDAHVLWRRRINLGALSSVGPIAAFATACVLLSVALQMRTEMRVFQEEWRTPISIRDTGAIASRISTLQQFLSAKTWGQRILRPVARVEESNIPVVFLMSQTWAPRLRENTRLMSYMPIGSVPITQVELLALTGDQQRARHLLREALAANPRIASNATQIFTALANRGFSDFSTLSGICRGAPDV